MPARSAVSLRDVARFIRHHWRQQPVLGAASLAGVLGMVAVDVAIPTITGRIVGAMAGDGDPGGLGTSVALLALCAVLLNAFRWGAYLAFSVVSLRLLSAVVLEATRKVQRFSADWHANTFAGGTVRKISRGMWSFDMFNETLFFSLLPAALVMLGMTGMLLLRVPLVGAVCAGLIVVYLGFSAWTSLRLLAPRFRASAAADTDVGASLADAITGNPTVKAFGAETREDGRLAGVVRHWHDTSRAAWLMSSHVDGLRGVLRAGMLVGMVAATVALWRTGRATAGDAALVMTSFFIIAGYLHDIGAQIANLQKSVSEMEDVIAFWLRDDEVRDAPTAVPFRPGPGGIRFEDVRFRYQGTERDIYSGFSLTIRPGEKVALVGRSGAGKSTFVKLIQRLYDVTGGRITIDGQDIAQVTQASLRQAIALVPQDPILFHRSLAENIGYARPGASLADIEDAARKAHAHEFIAALPQGYDTLVGERGIKLSGGERQRVAIARAVLADAPILILDEATSSLDSVSEHHIQAALHDLMAGRTTIMIAHRLSTIRAVDRILVFRDGAVVEQGRHEVLVARPGSYYRELFEMQAMGLVG